MTRLESLGQELFWLDRAQHHAPGGVLSILSKYPPPSEEWKRYRSEAFAEERRRIKGEIRKERKRVEGS